MTTQTAVTSNGTRTAGLRLAGAALAAVLGGAAFAGQTTLGVGKLSNPGDEGRGSARTMGMDATHVGIADGAEALQWNPAGLGNLTGHEAGWHHLSGLGGSFGESVILGAPAGGMGGLALSLDVLDNGSFESRDDMGNLTGRYDARTVGGSLGYGVAIMQDVAVGAAVRGARQTLATSRYDSFAGDVGVLWNALPALTVGAAVANLGSSGSSSRLATGLRAGASWATEVGASNHLLLAAATEIQPGGINQLNVGAEDVLMSRLALRAGYRLNFTNQKLAGLTGLTAGVGLRFASLALDYAYLPFGELGNLHRVSLTYRGEAKSEGRPARAETLGAAGQSVEQREQAVGLRERAVGLREQAATLKAKNFDQQHVAGLKACGFDCVLERPDVLLVTMLDDKTRFDFDQDIIKPEGRKSLQTLADVLNRFPESTLRVDGFSDSLGTEAVKQDISQRRAQAVADALQEMGVAKKRFESVTGRSDAQPLVNNGSRAARRVNRRVELRAHLQID